MILFFTLCMILACSFLFSCFPVVDLLSHTGNFIDDVNILNISIGVGSSDQWLKKASMDDILLFFLNAQTVVCV